MDIANPRLATLAIEIETIKKRLSQVREPNERRVLLREMRERIELADAEVKQYLDQTGSSEQALTEKSS